MNFLTYMLVAFVLFFFTWKRFGQKMKDEMKSYELWFEKKEFWIITLFPLLWAVSIPLYAMWCFMDFIYKKFNK